MKRYEPAFEYLYLARRSPAERLMALYGRLTFAPPPPRKTAMNFSRPR